MIGTMLGVLFVCLLGTVPIAVSLGLSCVATFSVFNAGSNMTQMLAQSTVTSIDSFSLMAIPFFMLVGSLMERGGIAKKLVDVAEMMTGTMPGGLGMAAIVASMFFAAISGSGPATAAAIGGIMIGAMTAQGYSKGYSGALIAAGSTIGPVIPPSIPMITDWMMSITSSRAMIMLMLNIALLIIGMFLDTISSIVLFGPIFAPIAIAIGFDPLHFGIIMVINLCIGMLTPPMGGNLFVAQRLFICGPVSSHGVTGTICFPQGTVWEGPLFPILYRSFSPGEPLCGLRETWSTMISAAVSMLFRATTRSSMT